MQNLMKIIIAGVFILLARNAFSLTSGNCGTGCSYTLDDNGLLTVTGSGENASIGFSAFSNNRLKNCVYIISNFFACAFFLFIT